MKSTKKALFIFSTVALSTILTACGASTSSSSNSSENKSAETVKIPSAKEIIENYVQATQNIKSATFSIKSNISITSGTSSSNVNFAADGSISLDPKEALLDLKLNAGDESKKYTIYVNKNNEQFIKEDSANSWKKQPSDQSDTETYEQFQSAYKNDKLLKMFNELSDLLKVEENGDNYVLTYTGNDEKIKKILTVNEFLGSSIENEDQLNKVNIKNASLKLVIRKADSFPVDISYSIDIYQIANEANTLKVNAQHTYSNINSTTITAPKGI